MSLLAEADGTMYSGSTFAINRLTKPYKVDIGFNDSVHGGTNYSKIKDRDFVYNATYIHGPVTKFTSQQPGGIPQNVMVMGLGEGQSVDSFIDCDDEFVPNEKRKYRFTATVGRFTEGFGNNPRQGAEYISKVKGEAYWPSNIVSGNVEGGYHDLVTTKFKSGSIITNLHSDTFSPENEIGLQSPFTNAWVGGHQSRHVDLNKSSSINPLMNGLNDQYSRPEAWRLLLKECANDPTQTSGSISGSNDGAMGFVGPDYGGPYPDYTRKYAVRYREERVKRPVNLRNIQSTTASVVQGNYSENYEIISTFGRKENAKALVDTTLPILPSIFNDLKSTTQEASVIGLQTSKKAVAIITLAARASVDDTLTIGDGVSATRVLTYKASATSLTQIARGGDAAATRANTKAKLEGSLFNFTVEESGNTLIIYNEHFISQESQVTIEETYTDAANVITQQFEGAYVGNGNLVSNFNNSNRYLSAVKEQAKFDPDSGGNTIVATRFSAPGGAETMSEIFLDVPSKEYSVYNALPYRNLSVRSSGSGEDGTIRVNSQASRREGLQTHLRRHSGRFGVDSVYGYVTNTYIVGDASFEKTNRNTRVIPDLSSSALQRKDHDNGFVTRLLPSQDYGYSWVTASLNHALAPSTVRKVPATAKITVTANPSADDTVTVGDGVTTVTFTFKASAGSATEVTIESDVDDTRANLKTKIAAQFPNMVIQDRTVLNRLDLTNGVSGTLGNFALSETMGGSPSNIVTGFTGGEDIAQQLAFGFWPADGILSASADVNWRSNGFDSAVQFPTASFGNGLVGVYS